MTTENDSDDDKAVKQNENKRNDAAGTNDKNTAEDESGDPGRTPGAAEGDEETIDEDIREKEAEGKL